jgi:hypothetical protein
MRSPRLLTIALALLLCGALVGDDSKPAAKAPDLPPLFRSPSCASDVARAGRLPRRLVRTTLAASGASPSSSTLRNGAARTTAGTEAHWPLHDEHRDLERLQAEITSFLPQ